MFESIYVLAHRFDREASPTGQLHTETSSAPGWTDLQGLLAGFLFSAIGLAAVVLLSSGEKKVRRTVSAIAGALASLGLALLIAL